MVFSYSRVNIVAGDSKDIKMEDPILHIFLGMEGGYYTLRYVLLHLVYSYLPKNWFQAGKLAMLR